MAYAMKALFTLRLLLLLLVICGSGSAAIRPSFEPEESSWRATDIVVVTEGEKIDGVFTVLETWKGDLKPGETITIPEMAEFEARDARLIDTWSWVKNEREPPEYVTGERMILFLREVTKVTDKPEEDSTLGGEGSTNASSRWKSSNSLATEMKYSTVWVEKGKLNWFVQKMNPGRSLLSSIGISEAELKTEVSSVLSTQNALNAALAITDPATRAGGLEPFAQHKIYRARKQAFAGLAECGESALPVLRRMLGNELLREHHPAVIETFAKASRKTAGPELTIWMERELEFWEHTAPSLAVGWWNGAGLAPNQSDALEKAQPLRDRWMALYQAVQSLGEIRYTGAERVLSEISDFWRSLPQLYGDQIGEASDKVLRELGSYKEGKRRPAPKYEISFTGNKVFSSAVLTAKISEYIIEYDDSKKVDDGEDHFRYALRRLVDFISSQGYLKTQFTSSRKTTEQGEVISVSVDEGKQYRLGKITVEGANLFPAAHIRSLLALREGDIVDTTAIYTWLRKDLDKAYRDMGYFNFYADDDPEFRPDADVADFKIEITESTQYKVGSIKFEGTTTVTWEQLNGAMSLREGEVFSQTKLDDSIDALNKLGLKLDKEKDVQISENNSNYSVGILIVLK